MRWARSSLLVALAAGACQATGGDPNPVPVESTLCQAGPTYESFAGPFFLSWCTGCHGADLGEEERQEAPLGVNLDTKEGVEGHAADILRRVAEERTMPPAGGPSDEERELLRQWLDCGMPGDQPYFDPGEPEWVEPPPSVDTRECAKVREPIPEAMLPRCAPEARTCRQSCASLGDDEDAAKACRDACLDSDPTPAVLVLGSPVNCSACNLLQLIACAEQVGCREQVAGLMCCIEECARSGNPACAETECVSAIDAFGQCVYYQGEECLGDDGPYLSACYGG